jgi:hypothetical protein
MMTCITELATICAMWRRLHVLSPIQSLVVASVAAATIALPLAAQLVSRNERALLRSLFWPDKLNPYMTFSFVFIGVVPALLGYYHLGRLGFLLNVAAGFALTWIMAVCGMLCFAFMGHLSGSAWLSTVAYAACLALVYILIARLHLRAANSPSVRDAQRKLRLLPTGTV